MRRSRKAVWRQRHRGFESPPLRQETYINWNSTLDIPKFHEFFIPILNVLSSGEIYPRKELVAEVSNKYYSHLPAEVLNKRHRSGGSILSNRIEWSKSYLKLAGMVSYPSRGTVQITPKGQAVSVKGKLTLAELKQDPDYLSYQENKEHNNNSEEADPLSGEMLPEDQIEQGIASNNRRVKLQIAEKLADIDPYFFETIILKLLNRMGYGEFVETTKSADGGIDGIMNQDQLGLEKIYVQAKRFNQNKVRETDIRNFIGAMSGDTNKGVFVTTSTFDDAAKRKAREAHHKIILIDGEKLAELMLQFGIGVQVRTTYEFKTLDEDFFEQG